MIFISEDENWFGEWQARIIEWLENEELGSPMIVDRCWETETDDDGSILANSYCTPFKVDIDPFKRDDGKYMMVSVGTGVGTAMLEEWEKVEFYRNMLKRNTSAELVKFSVDGIDDDICIKAEFDLSSLSKEEFDHGMKNLLTQSTFVFTSIIAPEKIQHYIEEENWEKHEFFHVVEKLIEDLQEGNINKYISMKRLLDIGYEENEAMNLVEDIEHHISDDKESDQKVVSRGMEVL